MAVESGPWRTLSEFTLSSQTGNEREAIERVATAIMGLRLSAARVEQIKTAVSEATMNAIEHGNRNRPELPVRVLVRASDTDLSICITDQGGHTPIVTGEDPDLEAKLAGRQSPRGWGLFLIRNMVDDLRISGDEQYRTIELIVRL